VTDKRFEEKAAELLLWLGVNDNDCHKWTEPPIQRISTALAAVWNEAIEKAAKEAQGPGRCNAVDRQFLLRCEMVPHSGSHCNRIRVFDDLGTLKVKK
jgi:hypothetical protein